ncbi:MAG: methyltransferase domain-containing protein [Nitrospinae bacterium]|nr:methyltransferase domain-containing protein [Nitrospinota bacterium]
MPPKRSLRAESEEMTALARAVERSLAEGRRGLHHLSTPLGRANYLRKAEVVKNLKPDGGRLLDWGCGYGQMSYLLRNRGFEVVPYTIEAEEPSPSNLFLREQDLDVVCGEDPVRLPFEDGSFDFVLSCGVLEHVEDESGSLAEIRRILRPGGMFVVMMLPNEWSYAEFMARNIFKTSDHDRLYSVKKMRRLLARFGFRAVETWYSNILPKNFTPFPEAFRQSLGAHPHIWLRVEAWLSKIPPVCWFSGVVEGAFVRLS